MTLTENTKTRSTNINVLNNSGGDADSVPNVPSNFAPGISKQNGLRGSSMFSRIKQRLDSRGIRVLAFKAAANVVLVLLVVAALTKLLSTRCSSEPDDGALELFPRESRMCTAPPSAVNLIVVDVDLNSSAHCYSSRSCVELGFALRQEQGKLRYNFILGAFGFVYAPLGYNCASEEWEDAAYIRLPVESIYGGQDFMAVSRALAKLQEVLREGLKCGKLRHNFTLVASGCAAHNTWCTTALRDLMADGQLYATPPRLTLKDLARPGQTFNPFSLRRVYSYHYKLQVCEHRPKSRN